MVRRSNSSNVRAAATGIQRVAMAALMVVMAFGGLAMSAGRAEAQSKLPPCPSEPFIHWNECFGTLTFPGGSQYIGEWKDGKQSGQGTQEYPSGDKYVGTFKIGVPWGQGTFTFVNEPFKGDKYVGESKEGIPWGQGTYTWANGDKYVGAFWNMDPSGQGTFRKSSSGNLQIGTWKSGTRHGAGKDLDAMGKVIREGYWVDGDYFGPTPPSGAMR